MAGEPFYTIPSMWQSDGVDSPSHPRPLVKRIVVATLGATFALIGIAGLFLPLVPGLLFVLPGLALLAGEFVWARRLLDGVKSRVPLPSRADQRPGSDRRAA
jgi:hypothetical protein